MHSSPSSDASSSDLLPHSSSSPPVIRSQAPVAATMPSSSLCPYAAGDRSFAESSGLSSPKRPAVETPVSPSSAKRAKEFSVGVTGDQICGSSLLKTCHQCRQKRANLIASCKEMKKAKPCITRYCQRCLVNRYGERAEEVLAMEDWKCPKCRGVCNCSICMKKRGQQPTGILIRTAKANSYSSVHQLLNDSTAEGIPLIKEQDSDANVKERVRKRARNDHTDGENNLSLEHEIKSSTELTEKATVLPEGIPLTNVADIEWLPDDVGPALQFLEFCSAFGEVLGIENGQPEAILQEIAKECGAHGTISLLGSIHIKLLSMIQNTEEEDNPRSWIQDLGKFISESIFALTALNLDFLDLGSFQYENLVTSEKLRILNCLCDEVLCTEKMRNWIEKLTTKFFEEKKEGKQKISAAKKTEKDLKRKMKQEKVKAMLSLGEGNSLSVSEHQDHLLQIRYETEKAHAEVESLEILSKRKQSDALRTEPILQKDDMQVYWRLGCCGGYDIMLQEIGNEDLFTSHDKWFIYDGENKEVVEKYVASLRSQRSRRHKSKQTTESSDSGQVEKRL